MKYKCNNNEKVLQLLLLLIIMITILICSKNLSANPTVDLTQKKLRRWKSERTLSSTCGKSENTLPFSYRARSVRTSMSPPAPQPPSSSTARLSLNKMEGAPRTATAKETHRGGPHPQEINGGLGRGGRGVGGSTLSSANQA